ncbi:hypothetical protein [uncultured Gammaproteobacteria bacterium]|jgi:hypothetical protein|nr:hypothetical protein BROOK1789B_504 [Bathymodiolus brooksi thiotrophic gill symbiont]CAC9540441.1 hypothetical protein [uncultured Gammaproteobacteria bacterium]CAB9542257.1 hypothetical protein BROOK1789C_105 [Bathymodiolus brooksi thiotrophic gill symbiont]CAC9543662.1 hypothetical protein [uncultured Gammaproteobacteria bacterium]CAC9600563.1 hypothetical protein [uncultured Gammaproteobacteria bacterium]
MLRFIEKSFLKITQVVGLLFAIIVLVTAITIGYNKINIKVDKVEVPRIKLADYQKIMRTQEIKIGKNLDSNQYFNQEFDTYIDDIVSSLGSLPDSVISKTDLRQKVKISTRDKLSQHPQAFQLAYVKSLAKLTRQIANVGGKINMDNFVNWHDQAFFQKMQTKDARNFLQIGSLKIEKSAYFAIWRALAMFAMLVIMLAVLRIEKNTRN